MKVRHLTLAAAAAVMFATPALASVKPMPPAPNCEKYPHKCPTPPPVPPVPEVVPEPPAPPPPPPPPVEPPVVVVPPAPVPPVRVIDCEWLVSHRAGLNHPIWDRLGCYKPRRPRPAPKVLTCADVPAAAGIAWFNGSRLGFRCPLPAHRRTPPARIPVTG